LILFNGDALCQVAGHVRVVLAEDGKLVCQKLNGNDVDDGGGGPCVRHLDPKIKNIFVLGRNSNDISSAGFDFLCVVKNVHAGFIVGHQRDTGGSFAYQSYWSVFKLSSCESFGVDVGFGLYFGDIATSSVIGTDDYT